MHFSSSRWGLPCVLWSPPRTWSSAPQPWTSATAPSTRPSGHKSASTTTASCPRGLGSSGSPRCLARWGGARGGDRVGKLGGGPGWCRPRVQMPGTRGPLRTPHPPPGPSAWVSPSLSPSSSALPISPPCLAALCRSLSLPLWPTPQQDSRLLSLPSFQNSCLPGPAGQPR